MRNVASTRGVFLIPGSGPHGERYIFGLTSKGQHPFPVVTVSPHQDPEVLAESLWLELDLTDPAPSSVAAGLPRFTRMLRERHGLRITEQAS